MLIFQRMPLLSLPSARDREGDYHTDKYKIVIIDNITYLRHENERAKDALPLMKHLKRLKSKYNLSLLVLAHTPKRDSTKRSRGTTFRGVRC